MFGPQAAIFTEMFSTRMRYSGASFVYQATNVIAGGLAPFITLALVNRFDTGEPVARETRGVDIADDEPSADPGTADTETTEVPVPA